MGYLSSSASVSSAAGQQHRGVVQFQDRREAAAALMLDNKYLKRRSQVELQRLHDMHEGSITENCCNAITYNNIPFGGSRNRKYTTFLMAVLVLSLCSFLFLAGWLTAANYTSATSTSEDKSLHDLADSIRRMRLRRQAAAVMNGDGGDSSSQDRSDRFGVDEHHHLPLPPPPPKRLGHRYYNDRDPPEPPDELELLRHSEAEAQRLEQRIRATQDRQVFSEMKEKRMEDEMAESIQALKAMAYNTNTNNQGPSTNGGTAATGHHHHMEEEDHHHLLEEEGFFQGRRKVNNKK